MKLGLGRFSVNLSKSSPPALNTELGTTGNNKLQSLFDGEVISQDKIKIEDFRNMLDKDGTAQAMYSILTMPLLASGYSIEPEDKSAEAKAQAEFVQDVFSRPPHKGGMSTPFDLVLEDMLRAVIEGYRTFEKVFELNEQEKIVFKKIAQRDNTTVTLMSDDRGGFDGFKQYALIGSTWEQVKIPKERAFLYTFGKSFNWLKGRSAFMAAYYHYDKKHRAYYLANQSLQVSAIPLKTVTPNGKTTFNQTSLDSAVDAVDQLGFNSTVGIPDGFDVDIQKLDGNNTLAKDIIEHHNAEMARSILAQFMMLGTNSNTGSWALSSDQSDFFIQALNSVARSLEMHITSYLIADLINYNFETAKYPNFKFNNVSDATKALLKDFAIKVIERATLPEDFAEGVLDKVKAQLDIETKEKPKIDEEQQASIDTAGAEIQKQALNGAQIASLLSIVEKVVTGQIPYDTAVETMKASFPSLGDDSINAILEPTQDFEPEAEASPAFNASRADMFMTALSRAVLKKKDKHEHKLNRKTRRKLAKTWRRDLTSAETKVNFAAIEKKMDSLESEFVDAAKPVFEDIEKEVSKKVEKLLKAKDYDAIATEELIPKQLGDQYRAIINEQMLEAYTFGKVNCADEIDRKAPPTPQETKDLIKQEADGIVDKQFSDITFEVRAEVNKARRADQLSKTRLSIFDVLKNIAAGIGGYFDDRISLTGGVIVAKGINFGRIDVFEKYKTEIASYQYSAILDEVTCPTCEDLDGSVVSPEEYKNTTWVPPIHFNCRCIWVAIMDDEEEPPEETGLPDEAGGETAPKLSMPLYKLLSGINIRSRV